jgi:hypothetical protein
MLLVSGAAPTVAASEPNPEASMSEPIPGSGGTAAEVRGRRRTMPLFRPPACGGGVGRREGRQPAGARLGLVAGDCRLRGCGGGCFSHRLWGGGARAGRLPTRWGGWRVPAGRWHVTATSERFLATSVASYGLPSPWPGLRHLGGCEQPVQSTVSHRRGGLSHGDPRESPSPAWMSVCRLGQRACLLCRRSAGSTQPDRPGDLLAGGSPYEEPGNRQARYDRM